MHGQSFSREMRRTVYVDYALVSERVYVTDKRLRNSLLAQHVTMQIKPQAGEGHRRLRPRFPVCFKTALLDGAISSFSWCVLPTLMRNAVVSGEQYSYSE